MSLDYDATKYGTGRKTIGSYLTGLILSLIFTGIAFIIVAKDLLVTSHAYAVLAILAVLQLIAQVIFFLRINATPQGRWNLMPFLFTLIVAVILIGGSMWIMVNLNYNMSH